MEQQSDKNQNKIDISNIISWVLTIILIIVVIWGQIDGMYIRNKTVETCNGVVTDCHGDPEICEAVIRETKKLIEQNPDPMMNIKITP